MITITRTHDAELIKRMVTHPEVYPYLSDDGSPSRDEWQPVINDAVYYVLAARDSSPVGLWMFHPQNSVCYEGHSVVLPEMQGNGAEIAVMVQVWMFEHTPCQRIIGNAPMCNPRALYYAQKAGMQPFGVNVKSYLKDGVLYDQIVLGVSKEDVCH